MSNRNYARHIESGKLVFFDLDPPMTEDEYTQYAFYRVPAIEDPVKFKASVIGECVWQRCERLGHAPRECQFCLGGHGVGAWGRS